jgi:HK97 family phage portal protein
MSAATVMGLPAASRARYLISNAIAQMTPLQLWTPDGYIDPNPPTILTRPNSVYGTFDFVQMMIDMAVTHGNFCALQADFDSDGYPQQLTPLPHGFWLAYYDDDGYLVYSINGLEYSRDEVFHIRANASPIQPMGVGVVTQFRRSLGQALDQQNFVADTYRSGSIPAGTIELDLPEIDPLQATTVTNQWLTNHAGGRVPAVLPNTMKFVPSSWSPEDMQFLQSREFTVSEIAFMFNMDPTDLGAALAGASNTYANIEQHEQSRTINTYGSWMRRVEEEFSDLVPGRGQAKLVPANLMRTDTKTVAEVQQLEIGNEVLTVDEARKLVGKRPLPKPPKPPVTCPTCGVPVSAAALPAHLAAHVAAGHTPATFGKGAPPVPPAPNDNSEVLASATAQTDPDDPNISQTPIKIKV